MNFSKKILATIFVVFSLIFSFSITSCSKKLGYSVVLWSIPEENLTDGTVVPVYIKSNISHCYVIGIPGTDMKCEVPLWKITEPISKRKIAAVAQKYSEYQHYYARVKRDGLPIRFEPQNTSRQIYRTRENEVLKVLYKGKGAQVMAGNKPLEGEWLRVLTADGSSGWCFSYNLEVYNEANTPEILAGTNSEENIYDDYLKKVLNAVWYPEEYQKMINEKRVDLSSIFSDYRFDTGFVSGTVKFKNEDFSFEFPFNGLTKTGNRVYRFNDSNLTMTVRTSVSIFLQYVDETGKQQIVNLASLGEDLSSIIFKEKTRRENEFAKIFFAGPTFSSSNYGKITFHSDGTFSWTGYKLLTPSLISSNATTTGKASIEYFISPSLKNEYDGIITLNFDEKNSQSQSDEIKKSACSVNFLYKIESNGIRFEDVQKARIKDKVVQEKSSNPVVIFFGK